MAQIEITVPSFVKGEPGFAAKLNELSAAVAQIAAFLNETQEPAEAPAPVKATASRKATAKAE